LKIDTSVYVHVPFCSRRCIYCDFVSFVRNDLIGSYFESLIREIDIVYGTLGNRKISTLYFGGGTPSHVPVKYISKVIEKLSKSFEYDPVETTLEMNPEDVSEELCKNLKSIGINRISVGLQTSSDQILKVIGRPYDFNTFMKAYKILRNFFDNVNVDLIYNLPFEKFDDVMMDLKVIKMLNADHISFYELELHEETPLYPMIESGIVKLPEEDVSEKMYDTIVDTLEDDGYKRYELSSWTKHKPSFHNLNYWKNGEYLGLGLSSGSHLSMERSVNTEDLIEYIEKIRSGTVPRTYHVKNSPREELAETLFMGLRVADGVRLDELRNKFGDDLDFYLSKLKDFCPHFLECSEKFMRFTKIGMKFSASILSELV